MEINLREFRKGDLAALVALDAECFAPVFLFDRRSMRRFAAARNAITLLAEADGALVGFVIVHVVIKQGRAIGTRVHGYVVTLDVAPEHRRCGLAGQLMDMAERRALIYGATWMELHVSTENFAAIRFYEGRGYLHAALQPGFYGAGLDACVYQKDLK